MTKLSVLFVCTGNICRSPTAEGVFRRQAQSAGLAGQLVIDSAATHDYHTGEPPDTRAQAAALRRGYDLSALRARQVRLDDFEQFDFLLGMDTGHLQLLHRMSPIRHRHKVRLFLDFAQHLGRSDVPDPYYGDVEGFELVLDIAEAASRALLDHLRPRLLAVEVRADRVGG